MRTRARSDGSGPQTNTTWPDARPTPWPFASRSVTLTSTTSPSDRALTRAVAAVAGPHPRRATGPGRQPGGRQSAAGPDGGGRVPHVDRAALHRSAGHRQRAALVPQRAVVSPAGRGGVPVVLGRRDTGILARSALGAGGLRLRVRAHPRGAPADPDRRSRHAAAVVVCRL